MSTYSGYLKSLPHHNCGKFTYEYVEILKQDSVWMLLIDLVASAQIFYCPFCGAKLE